MSRDILGFLMTQLRAEPKQTQRIAEFRQKFGLANQRRRYYFGGAVFARELFSNGGISCLINNGSKPLLNHNLPFLAADNAQVKPKFKAARHLC